MEWVEPRYTPRDVDRAGIVLRQQESTFGELVDAYTTLDNWRASHAFPLNTIQTVLRLRAREFDDNALVAQRLKRVPSVLRKLRDRRTMRLSQMQDIGGCRAVVSSLGQLDRLHRTYLERRSPSTLVGSKDYVAEPRTSGYRSIHLVYRYHSGRGSHRAVFDGHLIEIQLRTQVQHAWATAVETVGTLMGQAVKSSEGPEEWLELLKHVSSLFAYYEGTPALDGALAPLALIKHIRAESKRLRLRDRLLAFRDALRLLEGTRTKKDRYFLLKLDPTAESLEIKSFQAGQFEQATEEYLTIEKNAVPESGTDVVLVRADSIDALRRAYPNYFLDTQLFLTLLERLTAIGPRAKS